MTNRPINFCSGPAALPEPVLARMQAELLDFRGSRISVMEHSHRDDRIVGLFSETEATLKRLLGLGDAYRVLFLPGGATLQFSQVPMHLLTRGGSGGYITSGAWSEKAVKAAAQYGRAVEVASSASRNFTDIPDPASWDLPADATYLHICTNETIHGVEWFGSLADVSVPVVADMSSHILSRTMPVSEFDLIYAGAQKNLGTSGVTLVILKTELLDDVDHSHIPGLLQYRQQIANDSMVNTPPVLSVWVLALMLDWLESIGGVSAVEARNRAKAAALYAAIDDSALYSNPVALANRSLMNVPFVLNDAALDASFLAQAEAAGLMNLKGHRSVGGMRASIYNAISERDVAVLIEFMREFERTAG